MDWIDLGNQPIQSDWKWLVGGHPVFAGSWMRNERLLKSSRRICLQPL